ncbi:hypothetical protein JM93_00170 [Roseibium hamelinense]|uniref:Uncharacterized protein n=1 Tax=Roseibium hamelinense TaxID=150831 RepID=A0A562THI4_9HYPH|nr:hypothetical protein [Roseibium hamelinense]MTI46180.1 hypothetical protein [Roseibium hamelinense]TWI92628.1 hypothetical protein JM93_00170 [Roseibium hamelinense]
MTIPKALRAEYEDFLKANGFDKQHPQELLLELASLSMEVYLKEIAWLSDFIGRMEDHKRQVA